jgi:hypothetical protein
MPVHMRRRWSAVGAIDGAGRLQISDLEFESPQSQPRAFHMARLVDQPGNQDLHPSLQISGPGLPWRALEDSGKILRERDFSNALISGMQEHVSGRTLSGKT